MSTIAVNTVTDANGGNTATINSMTPTADSLQGFRNRILNGNMVLDQRNAGASVTINSNQYTLDRYQAIQTQTGKYSVQQSTTAPTGFTNSMLITSASAYSVLSSDEFYFRQSIEGYNVSDLAFGTASAKTVTLSFWVRSSLTGTFGGALKNDAGDRAYPFTYTISVANTFEYKTITIAGDQSGTWNTGNGRGLQVVFGLGVGSTFSGTAGAWAGANYSSATGATSVVGTSGATWYITGVQLEVGSVATPFERRPIQTELDLCYRYCFAWRTDAGGTTWFGRFPMSFNQSGTVANTDMFLPKPMRTTSYSLSWNNKQFAEYLTTGGATGSSITLNTDAHGTNWVNIIFTFTSGSSLTTNSFSGIRLNGVTDGALIISTEL
jgi:hypothetical protein